MCVNVTCIHVYMFIVLMKSVWGKPTRVVDHLARRFDKVGLDGEFCSEYVNSLIELYLDPNERAAAIYEFLGSLDIKLSDREREVFVGGTVGMLVPQETTVVQQPPANTRSTARGFKNGIKLSGASLKQAIGNVKPSYVQTYSDDEVQVRPIVRQTDTVSTLVQPIAPAINEFPAIASRRSKKNRAREIGPDEEWTEEFQTPIESVNVSMMTAKDSVTPSPKIASRKSHVRVRADVPPVPASLVAAIPAIPTALEVATHAIAPTPPVVTTPAIAPTPPVVTTHAIAPRVDTHAVANQNVTILKRPVVKPVGPAENVLPFRTVSRPAASDTVQTDIAPAANFPTIPPTSDSVAFLSLLPADLLSFDFKFEGDDEEEVVSNHDLFRAMFSVTEKPRREHHGVALLQVLVATRKNDIETNACNSSNEGFW